MFVEIFNELLADNDLNKKQFSQRSGIPYPTIIGWTNLDRLPDYTALNKIADYFHCSVDYLMGRQEDHSQRPYVYPATPSEHAMLRSYKKLCPEEQLLILQLTQALAKKN